MPLVSKASETPKPDQETIEAMARIDAAMGVVGRSSPTSLVAQETIDPLHGVTRSFEANPLDHQSRIQSRVHRPYSAQRLRIVDALHTSPDDTHAKRARRMGLCCCCPTWMTNAAGELKPSLARCRDRMCPLCATRRSNQAMARMGDLVSRFNAPRAVTLTIVSKNESLVAMLDRLTTHWKTLKDTDLWRKHFWRGVWGLEITLNIQTGQWHAHMHLITDGLYMAQAQLKKAWFDITGDSYIVDIRAVHDRRGATWDLAGYISKPLDCLHWPDDKIREYATGTHGRRLIHTFGKCHAQVNDDDEDETPKASFSYVTHARTLLDAIEQKSTSAEHAREILARKGGDFSLICDTAYLPGLPGQTPVEPWEMAYALRVLTLCQETETAGFADLDYRAGLPGQDPPPWPPVDIAAARSQPQMAALHLFHVDPGM